MTGHELMQLGALDTVALIARGELSAREVAQARITVIERQQPQVRAFAVGRFDAALHEADAIDARRARGETLPPLAGVPMTVKEVLDVAGLPSTGGVQARIGHRAAADCSAVATLKQSGAVILGKGNVAQALIFIETDNPVYGRSSHPERADRTCGGSSGGEAALVALGGSAIGLGTDLGGSGRVPAAFCGIASLKPTAGRVPDTQRLSVPIGQQAVQSQLAPMARAVQDVELALQQLNPPHLVWRGSAGVDVTRLRVGVYDHDGLFPASPGVRRAVREAAAALKRAGATVIDFKLPDPGEAFALFYGAMAQDGGAGLRRLLAGGARDPRVAQLMFFAARSRSFRCGVAALAQAAGQKHLPTLLRTMGAASVDDHWQLIERRDDYRLRFEQACQASAAGALDVLISPPVATPAFTHGATKDLGLPGIYSTLYNVLGWPAGVLPWGRVKPGEESDRSATRDLAEKAAARVEQGSAGLPLSVQVAARPWREDHALAVMRLLESQRPAA